MTISDTYLLAFIKRAAEEKKPTYPISRFLTSPLVSAVLSGLALAPHGPVPALIGAGVGAGQMALARWIYSRARKGRKEVGTLYEFER